MRKFFLKKTLPNNWSKTLKSHSNLGCLSRPEVFINSQLKKKINIFPSLENVFKAFELCPFDNTNVVILDKIHILNQAC